MDTRHKITLDGLTCLFKIIRNLFFFIIIIIAGSVFVNKIITKRLEKKMEKNNLILIKFSWVWHKATKFGNYDGNIML